MKNPIIAFLMSVLLLKGAAAQDYSRVYTEPVMPAEKALDRLNLKLGWRTYVPTESSRDGIYSIHLLGDQLIVQKRSGMVVSLNAETGVTQWRTGVGVPYRVTTPLGHNSRSIFAISGIRLFALDRATGAVQWQFTLPHAAAAAPAADDDRVYLPLSNRRLYVYELPLLPPPPGVLKDAPATSPTATNARVYATPEQLAHEPIRFLGDIEVGAFLEQPPLITTDRVIAADTLGEIVGFPKGQSNEAFRFSSGKPISAPLAQYGHMVYAATNDFDVYAIDTTNGVLEWRMTADRLISRKPSVTDNDVYLAPFQGGLYRVERKTGLEVWRNAHADRFLAHNRLFTYALDRFGGMLVLDRARGTELSCLYVGDFVVPVANDQTDRIYLAANNGLIICLHDRDYSKPLRLRAEEAGKPAPAAPPQSERPAAEPPP